MKSSAVGFVFLLLITVFLIRMASSAIQQDCKSQCSNCEGYKERFQFGENRVINGTERCVCLNYQPKVNLTDFNKEL
ncbi:unnamed protein product [Bursaphelenchus okinawaensis]|uniref:Uncharacterized protein n=1 Tax=Bursaphelenchus okinawaensis TaxID=465554 RepID=A0A811KCD4_9BILA|nr:unnamed protein product [Bursaphelenchus okinawaensis]CAG9096619.1 unnamed protein product [Bursaphelenchus okinawaensis]